MPLTEFQQKLGRLLASNRREDSYLAGGAAILSDPRSRRTSEDLDFFHDTVERVASAFSVDKALLEANGYDLLVEISQPGYVRAEVRLGSGGSKVEWAQDSTWRFMPVISHPDFGYMLHPVDLATNKILALAGRDEVRDVLDALHFHRTQLPLGAWIWAAVGKDPGYSPHSLIELLRRRSKIQPDDLMRLRTTTPPNLVEIKAEWRDALEDAEAFIASQPPDEVGCLYFAVETKTFVDPRTLPQRAVVPHFGKPGGALPRILE